ncbi:hypothetical protein Vretimale_4441 [Volvox reticuliferus]|uniref:Uncharacterized protein n=1 Tax=Volvox reticuliferus TaxID=1737510 RepID=A0A8J4C6M3_9CHLO|nr:hypothetical protein Vretifemale_3038 [Volvox reticuliferus]GIL99225.1 hypothetical protein Vretimale_4441 [Volvox reticuliferus]
MEGVHWGARKPGSSSHGIKAAFNIGSVHNGFARLEEEVPLGAGEELRQRWMPEESAGFLSSVFFSYCNGLVRRGYERPLEHDDLWDVAARDEAALVASRFQAALAATADPVKHPQGVVWKAMVKVHGRNFFVTAAIKLIHDVIMFMSPYLLELLLHHMSAGGSRGGSFGLAVAILAVAVLENFTVNWYFHILFRMSLHLKIALIDMIYDKSLRVTSSVKSEMGTGAIVNLQSNDTAKLWSLVLYLHVIWNGPFQILVVMFLLVRIMNWGPSMAGLAVTVVVIPLTALLGKALAKSRREQIKYTDQRVKLCSEVITGIKAIKLYAWEVPYVDRIQELREKELSQIKKTQALSMFNTAMFMSGPVLVGLAAFGTHTAMGYTLTAAVAFPALALFNLLRFPIIMLPSQIMSLIQARVGLQRIQKFMEEEEMSHSAPGYTSLPSAAGSVTSLLSSGPGGGGLGALGGLGPLGGVGPAGGSSAPLTIRDGTFSWDATGEPVLKGVSLEVRRGQLVMVVGQVGSGKSSLLAALLGEMHRRSGSVRVVGSVAYTAQDPWIQNTTLRNNVLMGSEFDEEAYVATVQACALVADLELLPAGDASEIGEKGINLSGGQKHRVALARATYTAADIYLLDDPLSAVDAHVGRHLFDECICGLLEDKTRLLVTHQLQYLPSADLVVVMAGGAVQHVGTYDELVSRGVDFHQFVKETEEEEVEKKEKSQEDEAKIGTQLLEGAQQPPVDKGRQEQEEVDKAVEGVAEAAGGALPGVDIAGAAAAGGGATAAATSAAGTAEDFGGADGAGATPVTLDLSIKPRVIATGGRADDDDGDGSDSNNVRALIGGSSYSFGVLSPGPLSPSKPSRFGGGSLRRLGSSMRQRGISNLGLEALYELERQKLLETMAKKEKDGKLTKVEERAKGRVERSVYAAYLSAWSVAYLLPVAVVIFALGERGLQVLQNFVLSAWSNATAAAAEEHKRAHNGKYLSLYFILGLVSIGVQLLRSFLLILGSIRASRILAKKLLDKVVRLPMSFFDQQPTGRLLNRFTKDTEALDVNVSGAVNSALSTFVTAILSVVVVVVVTPLAVVCFVPLFFVYYRVQQLYIASSRELKRLDSLAFSPIFQHFGESLAGLTTIRAFRKMDQFMDKNRANLNHSNRAYWPIQVVNRWLSVRLELMGAMVVFSAAVTVAVIFPRNAGLAGLAITSALNLTGIMNWMVRQTTELEVNMNSVERMVEYNRYNEEAPAVIEGSRPPKSWPSEGAISVKDLYVRYRPELEPVLHGLTFEVSGREKIGVCGRTGCGKSTLMVTLYRLVEPSSGTIQIDGYDITAMGLYDLRSRLSLVPQDPVIFSGTVRSNLDPFGQFKAGGDNEMWEALRRAGMDETVRAYEKGLDSVVKEGGANMSVGQRQLLCMARALLRASRILVLDEATSNVDNSTDSLIQRTIRTAFKDCTVLTIAHRLHTIVDSDRILLLEAGQLGEFGTPAQLLRNPDSHFRSLVEETMRGGGATADVVAQAFRAANASGGGDGEGGVNAGAE